MFTISLCVFFVASLLVAVVYAVNYEKFIWRDLTESELKQWYSPVDLCMMGSTHRNTFPMKIRQQNCSHIRTGGLKSCGIGMGQFGRPCHAPFVARKSFKRGVIGYTNASTNPLLEVFANLARTNTTLVMAGDSTTRQKVLSMECELWREHQRNSMKYEAYRNQVLPCEAKQSAFLEDGSSVPILSISMGPSSVNCLKGGKGVRDGWGGIFENVKEQVRRINQEEKRNVMLVANIGLWYNEEQMFRKALPGVLEWLVNVTNEPHVHNVVGWHETMSQHWPNDIGNGYFDRVVADDLEKAWTNGTINFETLDVHKFQSPYCCQPISNSDRKLDWRNEIVREVMRSDLLARERIRYFPFADITRDVPDMHVCHPWHLHDCTHYCYWPLLWQPFWHQMSKLSRQLQMPEFPK